MVDKLAQPMFYTDEAAFRFTLQPYSGGKSLRTVIH